MSEIGRSGGEPNGFEEQLMQALRRVDAPEGFAARVMERASKSAIEPAAGSAKVVALRPRLVALRFPAWTGGAIAAMLVLGLVAGEQVHARHEREQAALANQEFATAVRATDQALGQVRAQLAQSGLRLQ